MPISSTVFRVLLLVFVVSLYACSSGGGGGTMPAASTPPVGPTLNIGFGLKQLLFSWAAFSGTDNYRLLQSPDGVAPFTQVGGNLTTTSATMDIAVHRQDWAAARFALDACSASGCTRSSQVTPAAGVLQTIGYVKASNTDAGDQFGIALALSADGNTLAVGANGEDSSAAGINGDQSDNSATIAGAVYIFSRSGSGSWSQQAYVKASNTGLGDQFGYALALSGDGNTLAVGALREDSAATGIGGNQTDETAANSGAVYVFTRSPGGIWSQQAYIKASNTGAGDQFGASPALNSDGNTLAVSAPNEDSAAPGIGGNQADDSASDSGAVYVFTRTTGGAWSQQAYIKASNTESEDEFGWSVALNGDGNTLAVNALFEDSSALGIGGNQADSSAAESGAVYLFTRSTGGAWSQQAYVKAPNTAPGDRFGNAIAISGDGNILVAGANEEDSNATGIGGNQNNNSAASAGAVYVYERTGSIWSHVAYIKASNTQAGDWFGLALALSGDGNTLAVNALGEDSAAAGINGNQADNSAPAAAAVYVFARGPGGVWKQQTYLKAPNTGAGDGFGFGVALSSDSNTLATGAPSESGAATGINGNQSENSAVDAGAVYLY